MPLVRGTTPSLLAPFSEELFSLKVGKGRF